MCNRSSIRHDRMGTRAGVPGSNRSNCEPDGTKPRHKAGGRMAPPPPQVRTNATGLRTDGKRMRPDPFVPLNEQDTRHLRYLNAQADGGADVREAMRALVERALTDERVEVMLSAARTLDPARKFGVHSVLGNMLSSGERQNRTIEGDDADSYMSGAFPKLTKVLLRYGEVCESHPRDTEFSAWLSGPKRLWLGTCEEVLYGDHVRELNEHGKAVADLIAVLKTGQADLRDALHDVAHCTATAKAFEQMSDGGAAPATGHPNFRNFLKPVTVDNVKYRGPDALASPGYRAFISAIGVTERQREAKVGAIVYDLASSAGLMGQSRQNAYRRRHAARERERIELAMGVVELVRVMLTLNVLTYPEHIIANGGGARAYDVDNELRMISQWLSDYAGFQ